MDTRAGSRRWSSERIAGLLDVCHIPLFVIMLVVLTFSANCVRAQADTDRIFEVRGVSVDAQAVTASLAQAQAISEGVAWRGTVLSIAGTERAGRGAAAFVR